MAAAEKAAAEDAAVEEAAAGEATVEEAAVDGRGNNRGARKRGRQRGRVAKCSRQQGKRQRSETEEHKRAGATCGCSPPGPRGKEQEPKCQQGRQQ